MTTTPSTARADTLYKIMAASGFLIDAFAELERLGAKPTFAMGVKNAALKFQVQLLATEKAITGVGRNDADYIQSLDQLHDSYILLDNLLTIMLNAGRKLTPQAQELLNNEMNAVATKYGVQADR